jgi:hypothetical protein
MEEEKDMSKTRPAAVSGRSARKTAMAFTVPSRNTDMRALVRRKVEMV